MNLAQISDRPVISPVSLISFILVGLLVVAIFAIAIRNKSNIKKIDRAIAVLYMGVGIAFGIGTTFGVQNWIADEKSFSDHLAKDYGVSTEVSLDSMKNAGVSNRIVIFSDEKGKFEVRPYLYDNTLTFFRVDNGSELKPKN